VKFQLFGMSQTLDSMPFAAGAQLTLKESYTEQRALHVGDYCKDFKALIDLEDPIDGA
jgi:hypothetical protein